MGKDMEGGNGLDTDIDRNIEIELYIDKHTHRDRDLKIQAYL